MSRGGGGKDERRSQAEDLSLIHILVRASRRRMLESMVGYCYTTGCLRAYILRYFGEGGHDEALPSQGGATEVAPYGGAGAGGANLLDGAACAPDSRDGHAACDPPLRRGCLLYTSRCV